MELVAEEERRMSAIQSAATCIAQEKQKENSRETTNERDKAQTVCTTVETSKEANEEVSSEQTEEVAMKMISVRDPSPPQAKASTEEQGEKLEMNSEQESKQFYELKAALTSMWLPAVVGDKKNFFIAASLSTLITKILMLLVSVILAYFFQEELHPHPFIFWSRVGKMFNQR